MPAREPLYPSGDGHGESGGEGAFSGIEAPSFSPPDTSRATRRPRRAGKPASASGSPTICGPSARPSSRANSPATSRRPSICCCSNSPGAVFTTGYHDDALDIRTAETPDRPAMRVNDDAFGTINVGEKHLKIDRVVQSSTGPACPMQKPFPSYARFPNTTSERCSHPASRAR